ncbi:MAG: hypothetical protein WAK32_01150 [Xanthobacteraceae bacterium]
MVEYGGSKDAHATGNDDKSQADDKGCRSIVITNDNRNVYPHAAQENGKKPNWVEKGTLIVLFLTLGAALFAGFEAYRLADSTENTAKEQLRAYVDIGTSRCAVRFVKPDQPKAFCTVVVKNFGLTPSNYVAFIARTVVREMPLDESKPLPPPTRNPLLSRLPPGGVIDEGVPTEEDVLTADQVTSYTNGTGAIYSYGDITFDDEFRRRCIIKFRLRNLAAEGTFVSLTQGGNSVLCSTENKIKSDN